MRHRKHERNMVEIKLVVIHSAVSIIIISDVKLSLYEKKQAYRRIVRTMLHVKASCTNIYQKCGRNSE